MTPAQAGRAIWFVLLFWIGTVGVTSAHSLPGSVLLLSQNGNNLQITLHIALEDLVLALPDVHALEDLSTDADLPAEQFALLSAYFSDHLALKQGTTSLPVSLTRASLSTATNDHVGAFTLVEADMTAPLSRTENVFPLTLSYDAVMREIRSHSAMVYWAQPNASPVGIAEFRYKSVDGRPRPIHLAVP